MGAIGRCPLKSSSELAKVVTLHTARLSLTDVCCVLRSPVKEAFKGTARRQPGQALVLAYGSQDQRSSWERTWPSSCGPPSTQVTLLSLAPRLEALLSTELHGQPFAFTNPKHHQLPKGTRHCPSREIWKLQGRKPPYH